MDAMPTRDPKAGTGQETVAAQIAFLKTLLVQGQGLGLVSRKVNREMEAVIADLERDEANDSTTSLDAEVRTLRETVAAKLARAKALLAQAQEHGFVSEEENRDLKAWIAELELGEARFERDEARRTIDSIVLRTDEILAAHIIAMTGMQAQLRLDTRAALRRAWWPGPHWRRRWREYERARSSGELHGRVWEESAARAIVELASAVRGWRVIITPEACENFAVCLLNACEACRDAIKHTQNIEMAQGLASAVATALLGIHQAVSSFAGEQRAAAG